MTRSRMKCVLGCFLLLCAVGDPLLLQCILKLCGVEVGIWQVLLLQFLFK